MRCARLAVLAGTAAFALGGLGYTVVATLGGDWTTTSGTVFTGNTAMLVVYLLFAMWLVDLFGLIVFFRYVFRRTKEMDQTLSNGTCMPSLWFRSQPSAGTPARRSVRCSSRGPSLAGCGGPRPTSRPP